MGTEYKANMGVRLKETRTILPVECRLIQKEGGVAVELQVQEASGNWLPVLVLSARGVGLVPVGKDRLWEMDFPVIEVSKNAEVVAHYTVIG